MNVSATASLKLLGAAGIIGTVLAGQSAIAAVHCTLTNFRVEAYDHGGVYLHGSLNGVNVNFIGVCGMSGGVQNCDAHATRNRLAVALTAQASGKSLNVHFWSMNTCSEFLPYTVAAAVTMND